MGIDIIQENFTAEERERFNRKIRDNLTALDQLLAQPDFGVGLSTLGAELEFYLVDKQGYPAPCSQHILAAAQNPQLTPELNRFNLEYNLKPQPFAGSPFKSFERELSQTLASLAPLARKHGAELLPIGILPTATIKDFGPQAMTDLKRYHAMDNALRALRGAPFEIQIDGNPPLNLSWDDVTLEGANTSFQLHWRVNPAEFADAFNAVQLVTPIVLGLGANSPTLFGHDLWEETRIALFKQSIDCRDGQNNKCKHPPRVYFGNGWLHDGPVELFASTIALFPPIMPVIGDEDPLAMVANGERPELQELKIHQGSTWPWNRAIYDHHDGGHVRIEMRALPAGPSLEDMSANAAFLLGSAMALQESMKERTRMLPFKYAEHNFYRAAQSGLDATILWPSSSRVKLLEYPLLELAQRLLPLAEEALLNIGLEESECHRLLTNIEQRINHKTNGARWQRTMTEVYMQQGLSKHEALKAMLERYRHNFSAGLPIYDWSTQV